MRVRFPPPALVMIKPKVITIVGPTASGKTSLSIQLAQKFDGEVVSADSRQVYRGLDIGTGKVTAEEMDNVPHHLLDIADPRKTYTVTDFVRDGRAVISTIVLRNKLPIVVGGTFFYVDALLGRVTMPDIPPNQRLRAELELLDTETLTSMLRAKDPHRAEEIDRQNRRRLIRALEIVDAQGTIPKVHRKALYDTLTIGISITKELLQKNIHTRLMDRLKKGMVTEVEQLLTSGLPRERLKELGIEYQYIIQYLEEKISYEKMCAEIETKSWQYAKRQMTWLKRDKDIVWMKSENIQEIEKVVEEFLKR